MIPTEDQLRKLIELRNKKIIAQEKYKKYSDEMCILAAPHVQKDDPLNIELDGKEYEFVWSEYFHMAIFRPKMRKGGNCYGTAVKNNTNVRRPVWKHGNS